MKKTLGYCWSTYFKVLGVLFLGEVSSVFLPSLKAYWTHKFRHLGVGQQYRDDFRMPFPSRCIRRLAGLPDHLIRQEQQRWGYRDPERLGSLQVHNEVKFRGSLHGQVGRFSAPQDAVDVDLNPTTTFDVDTLPFSWY